MLELTDLFCGAGLASSPALTHPEEFRLAFALDRDLESVSCIQKSHPSARVRCRSLPGAASLIPLPNAATHLHASPSCVGISSARRDANPEAKHDSLLLLAWAIEYALEFAPPTFSIEDVSAEEAQGLCAHYKRLHPENFDFAILDASAFGAPQRRIRLIAGCVDIIAALKEQAAAPRRKTVAAAFAEASMPLPASHIRAVTGTANPKCLRACASEPAFTVVASRAPIWCDADGTAVRGATVDEVRVLMEAPTSLILPAKKADAMRSLGNGVCGGLALAILRAAASAPCRETWTPPPVHPDSVEARCAAVEARARAAVVHATRKRMERSKVAKLVAERGLGFSKRQKAEAVERLVAELGVELRDGRE
eukprot:7391773-Prymnesium_polylepis.1